MFSVLLLDSQAFSSQAVQEWVAQHGTSSLVFFDKSAIFTLQNSTVGLVKLFLNGPILFTDSEIPQLFQILTRDGKLSVQTTVNNPAALSHLKSALVLNGFLITSSTASSLEAAKPAYSDDAVSVSGLSTTAIPDTRSKAPKTPADNASNIAESGVLGDKKLYDAKSFGAWSHMNNTSVDDEDDGSTYQAPMNFNNSAPNNNNITGSELENQNSKNENDFNSQSNDDEEILDEDALLESELDIKLNTIAQNCKPIDVTDEASIPKKRACKNCSCGLKQLQEVETAQRNKVELTVKMNDMELDNETKTETNNNASVSGSGSGCGNCAKGDAFRCGSCPYSGLPKFEAGTKPAIKVKSDGTKVLIDLDDE